MINYNINIIKINGVCLFICLSLLQSCKTHLTDFNDVLHKNGLPTPGSDIGLFPFPYLSSFQDDGFFSDVSTCQIGSFYFTLLYNNNALVFQFN